MKKKSGKQNFCPTCGSPLLFALEPSTEAIEKVWPTWLEELEARRLSNEYVNSARQRFRDYIKPSLKGIAVTDIKTHQIKKLYLTLLKAGLASKTVKHVLDLLRTFMNWCVEEELLTFCPKFPRVKVEYQEKRWLDRATQERIIEQVPKGRRLYYEVLIETGARVSETCALKSRDLVDGSVRIARSFTSAGSVKERKNGGEYFRPVSPELWKELVQHTSSMLPEAWLFTYKGETLNRHKVHRVWQRACKKAGVEISLQQGSRHSRATQLNMELEQQTTELLRAELGHTASGTARKHYVLGKRNKHG